MKKLWRAIMSAEHIRNIIRPLQKRISKAGRMPTLQELLERSIAEYEQKAIEDSKKE